jgi:hypothetical protein
VSGGTYIEILIAVDAVEGKKLDVVEEVMAKNGTCRNWTWLPFVRLKFKRLPKSYQGCLRETSSMGPDLIITIDQLCSIRQGMISRAPVY